MSKWEKVFPELSIKAYFIKFGNYRIEISEKGIYNQAGFFAVVTKNDYNRSKWLDTLCIENAKYKALQFFMDILIEDQAQIKRAINDINDFIKIYYPNCKDFDN